eukprot:TRINITY_DN2329_c0_g2_i1.p1 TRINITY_DN2329_c0_g2~~TRINITY_DN2329_c0_g2_i1.p1  ORF type:complete len:258 (-),score=61.83 TRINITY_DN2329_c0_g2_i1:72-845(-)
MNRRGRANARTLVKPGIFATKAFGQTANGCSERPERQSPTKSGRKTMSDVNTVLSMIKEHDCKFVDLRFTDPRGKMQHVTQAIETIDEESLVEGFMFDGSSIAGWKAINESDMSLKLDLSTARVDPFFAQPTLMILCDVVDPITGQPYERDPRSTAKAALNHLNSLGIGDTAFFGPEAEFFVFEDVKIKTGSNIGYYEVDHPEGPYNSARAYEEGNMGHRPGVKGGYFPVPPVDSDCLLYTSPSPRDRTRSRMPSSA